MNRTEEFIETLRKWNLTTQGVYEKLRELPEAELGHLIPDLEIAIERAKHKSSQEETKAVKLKEEAGTLETEARVVKAHINNLPREDAEAMLSREYRFHPLEYKLSKSEFEVLEKYYSRLHVYRNSLAEVHRHKQVAENYSKAVEIAKLIIKDSTNELGVERIEALLSMKKVVGCY